MSSVIGPFYYPKKTYVYIFHKLADFMNEYRKDNYHFYGFGFEASDKSSTALLKDMKNLLYLSDNEWQLLMNTCYKSLRISKVFDNFYKRHQLKQNRKYDISCDLNMEPLITQSERMKIILFHENTEYEFKIQDLLRIIKNALLTNDDLHLNSMVPKNPYNNIDFTQENLYKLFLTMRERNYPIPEIFYKFIKCNMKLELFMMQNLSFLRNQCIDDYHTQFNNNDLFEEIILMLRTMRINSMYIHIGYSPDDVREKLRPLLTLYWKSTNNLLPDEKSYYRRLFIRKLGNFIKENPTFGRIIISRNNRSQQQNDNDDENDDISEFKIKNYLSDEIPYHLNTIRSIKNYMRNGPRVELDVSSFVGIDWDEDGDDNEYSEDDLELVN